MGKRTGRMMDRGECIAALSNDEARPLEMLDEQVRAPVFAVIYGIVQDRGLPEDVGADTDFCVRKMH